MKLKMDRVMDNTYADMLMQKIEENQCNVYLVNTGMGSNKIRQYFYKKLCKTSNRSHSRR